MTQMGEKEYSMFVWTGLALLILGIVVWLFGNRLWLIAAGAGALLGIGLLRLFPDLAGGVWGLLIVAGLAIALGALGFFGKAFAKMIALIIGFVAGGGIALGFLDMFAIEWGFMDWIIALLGGAVGALLFARFFDWALIILASLVGSMLVVRGAMAGLLPALSGPWGGLLVLVLTGAGIYYHYRRRAGKPASTSPAGSAGAT
jgi:hypothetical protein